MKNISYAEAADKIMKYFTELGYSDCIICGSFIESLCMIYPGKPNDIDVVIVTDNVPEKKYKSFYLQMPDNLVINAEFMDKVQFYAELNTLQPKYLLALTTEELSSEINKVLDSKELHEVRSYISEISSKAFNKGKKKLQPGKDYDEVLGLKNLYHAFKFLIYTKWNYYPELSESTLDYDVEYLNEIYNQIFSTYKESNGSLEERCKNLIEVIKPKYLLQMTEFRKLFPKKVN